MLYKKQRYDPCNRLSSRWFPCNPSRSQPSPDKWVASGKDFTTIIRPRERATCEARDPGMSITAALHDPLYWEDHLEQQQRRQQQQGQKS